MVWPYQKRKWEAGEVDTRERKSKIFKLSCGQSFLPLSHPTWEQHWHVPQITTAFTSRSFAAIGYIVVWQSSKRRVCLFGTSSGSTVRYPRTLQQRLQEGESISHTLSNQSVLNQNLSAAAESPAGVAFSHSKARNVCKSLDCLLAHVIVASLFNWQLVSSTFCPLPCSNPPEFRSLS